MQINNKTGNDGPTPQQEAAANKNKHQHSSVVFGGDEQASNKTASNSTDGIKPSNLTPQQQAIANKHHNQQSSFEFGDGTSHNYGSNDNHHQTSNRVTNETVNIKNKQQRCAFNPITGQAY